MITAIYFLALAASLLPLVWSLGIKVIVLILLATLCIAKILNNITELFAKRFAPTHYASSTHNCVGSWYEEGDYIFFDIIKDGEVIHQLAKRSTTNIIFIDSTPHADYWMDAYDNLLLLITYNYTNTGINLYLREADKRSV